MTDDELALIRAAAADPDEDTLRLAYADWLDEQGGDVFASQAAFARLQVRRSRLDLFDPDRATLLEEEEALSRKHKRDWNGRVHRFLTRSGYTHKVDARTGLLRGWSYHRGMIARVVVEAGALRDYAETVFALGPVECLRVFDWTNADRPRRAPDSLGQLLARLKLVSVVGTSWTQSRPALDRLKLFATVPVLDIRTLGTHLPAAELLALAKAGSLSPVVLYRATVRVPVTPPPRWRPDSTNAFDEVHVIDPHGKWDALRLGFADLTGEVLSPLRA